MNQDLNGTNNINNTNDINNTNVVSNEQPINENINTIEPNNESINTQSMDQNTNNQDIFNQSNIQDSNYNTHIKSDVEVLNVEGNKTNNHSRKNHLGLIVIIVLLIIAAILAYLFIFNRNDKKGNTGSKTENDVTEKKEKESITDSKKTDDILSGGVYKVPISNTKIFVDTPNLHQINSGYVKVFLEDYVKLLSFTGINFMQLSSLQEVLNESFKCWTGNLMNYLGIRDESPDNANLTYENITVHGIETLKFKGTVKVGFNPIYDAYIYGYAFIYDGVPCSIMGAVIDQEQPQSEKDYIEKAADAMMKSVRSEP